MAEFTAQQLRNISPTVRKQITTAQRQAEEQQRKIEAEQQNYNLQIEQSKQQKIDLQNRMTQLRADIKVLEVKETRGSMASALEAASTKYGKQAELKRLGELYSGLGDGTYYSNYSDIISNVKAEAKAVSANAQAGFNPAIESQRQTTQQVKQQTVTYEKVYLDSAGNPISIAPSIAEAQIRKQNLEAEKKMSMAPVIRQYFNPQKITKTNIVKAVTVSPEPSFSKGKAVGSGKYEYGFKGGVYGYYYNPTVSTKKIIEKVSPFFHGKTKWQKAFDQKVSEARERKAWEGKQKELGKAEYNIITGEAKYSPPRGESKADYNLDTNEATKKKEYYDGRFVKESMTLGVEVETGKKAAKWGLNTQNANLQDNYFVRNRLGFWKNMGVYDESKMGTESNIKKWYDKSEVKEIVTSKGKGEYGPTYKSYEETFGKPKQNNPLPYGIQPVQNIAIGKVGKEEQAIITGEKFNIFAPSFFIGGQVGKLIEKNWKIKDEQLNPTFTTEERARALMGGGGTAQDTTFKENKIGFVRNILDREVPSQNFLTQVTAGLSLGTFFGPAMQTGTSGALERQAQGKQGALTKEEINALRGRELLREAQNRLIKKTTLAGQEKELTKFVKEFKLTGPEIEGLRNALYSSGVLKPIPLNPVKPTTTIKPTKPVVKPDVPPVVISGRYFPKEATATPSSTAINPTNIRDVNLGAVRTTDVGKIGGEMSANIGSTANINTNFGIGSEILNANPSLVNMEYAGALTGVIGTLNIKDKNKEKDKLIKKAATVPAIGFAMKEVSATKTDVIPKTKPRQVSSSASALNSAQVPKLAENLKSAQQPKLSSATSSALLSSLLSATSQVSSSKLKQPQDSLLRQSSKTRRKITPKPLLSKGSGKQLVRKKKKDNYEAFIYKSGKPKSIGTFDLLPSASKKLSKELGKTLAASGYVTKKGKKIKATKLGLLGEDFRLSKTGNKFLVVERKTRRLRKGSTGKEIQFFR